jgi:N-methylhydantoinase B
LLGTGERVDVENSAFLKLPPDSVSEYQNGGGSGVGPAINRAAQAVCDDVLDELVSIKAAQEKYGVVFTGSVENYDLQVDLAATAALRKEMSRAQAAKAA